MKRRKMDKKLFLGKRTIARLDRREQGNVKGGYWYTEMWGGTECHTWHPYCPSQPEAVCNTELSYCICKTD